MRRRTEKRQRSKIGGDRCIVRLEKREEEKRENGREDVEGRKGKEEGG